MQGRGFQVEYRISRTMPRERNLGAQSHSAIPDLEN